MQVCTTFAADFVQNNDINASNIEQSGQNFLCGESADLNCNFLLRLQLFREFNGKSFATGQLETFGRLSGLVL